MKEHLEEVSEECSHQVTLMPGSTRTSSKHRCLHAWAGNVPSQVATTLCTRWRMYLLLQLKMYIVKQCLSDRMLRGALQAEWRTPSGCFGGKSWGIMTKCAMELCFAQLCKFGPVSIEDSSWGHNTYPQIKYI